MVGNLERPVRRVERHFEEEGLLRVLLDELHRPLGEQIRGIAGDVRRLGVLEQIVLTRPVGVLVVIDQAALESEEVVEPMGVGAELRLVAQMPLADETGAIAVVLEQLRQGAASRRQPLILSHACGAERVLDPRSLLIAAADQHRSRRRAVRCGVEVGQPGAILRKAVDVGRLDVRRPIAANVTIADVVGDDQDHVRTRGLGLRGGGRGTGKDGEERECCAHDYLKMARSASI